MTRRIVLVLLALTAAVLVGAVVPLALQAVAHERDSFVNAAEATARSVAVIAEDKLGDHAADPALEAAAHSAARQDDELLVLNQHGHVVASHLYPHDNWRQVAAETYTSGDPATMLTKDRVIVVEPILNDDGTQIGTIVLERPTASLNQSIDEPVAVPRAAQRRRDGGRGADRDLLRPLGGQAAGPAGHRGAARRQRRSRLPRGDRSPARLRCAGWPPPST